jgi:hypothetical protein
MFNGHVNGGEAKIPKEWEAHPQSTLHRAQQPAEMLREPTGADRRPFKGSS